MSMSLCSVVCAISVYDVWYVCYRVCGMESLRYEGSVGVMGGCVSSVCV